MPHEQHKNQKLGRGLSALFNQNEKEEIPQGKETVLERESGVTSLPVAHVFESPFQSRKIFKEDEIKELAVSIESNGLLQPIIVRKTGEAAYELVAGERRWRAFQLLGRKEIPAIVRTYTDNEVLAVVLVENIQRSDLSALEEAEGYKKLLEIQYTQEEVATVVGKSRSHVANSLRLLSLPDFIKDALREGRLTSGHAKVLVGVEEALLKDVLEELLEKKLNVRDTETLIRRYKNPNSATSSRGGGMGLDIPNTDLQILEQQLMEKLGLPVDLSLKKDRAILSIRFSSLNDLDMFMSKISHI